MSLLSPSIYRICKAIATESSQSVLLPRPSAACRVAPNGQPRVYPSWVSTGKKDTASSSFTPINVVINAYTKLQHTQSNQFNSMRSSNQIKNIWKPTACIIRTTHGLRNSRITTITATNGTMKHYTTTTPTKQLQRPTWLQSTLSALYTACAHTLDPVVAANLSSLLGTHVLQQREETQEKQSAATQQQQLQRD